MSKRKFSGNFGGKGYYIALVLCAAAIGVSGYLYYRNAEPEQANLENKPASSQQEIQQDVPVAATENPASTEGASANAQAELPQESAQTMRTAAPVSGETVAEYAMDCLSYNQTTRDWRVHNGVDYAAAEGTAVTAAADGTVYTVYDDELMGTTVVIRHSGGYITKYSSLAKEVSVAPGDTVTLGQTVGFVGNTALLESAIGDHVHFSVTCNDEVVNPADFLGA